MKRVLYIILLVVLAACDSDYGITTQQPALVVEGWIEDGGFPVVILSQTIPVSKESQNMDDLIDYVIRWAKVTVSDGTDSVVLIGKYDDGYFPPYIYTTGRMRGRSGKTYSLTVDYKDYHAEATTSIPERPQLDSFKIEKCATSDSLLQMTVYFTDPPQQKNYYQLYTRVGTTNKQYVGAYLGSINDNVTSTHIEAPVFRGHELAINTYTPYYSVNDTVSIKLAQVDSVAFRFWDQYTKDQSLSTNLFLSTATNIPTNVVGSTGYWCGMGAVERHFIMADYWK